MKTWPLAAVGFTLIVIGLAAFGWVIVYAMGSSAAPADTKVAWTQYLCLFGGPAVCLAGIVLIVVGIVRQLRHASAK
jgi:hypothetical protein